LSLVRPRDKHHRLPASELARIVADARERTLELVKDLEPAQFDVCLLETVNPFRWELGHVAFFFESFVLRLLGHAPVLADGERLYDSFKVEHDSRWSLPLPSLDETLAYMHQIQRLVVERLGDREPDAEETYLYLLATLHEDMHGEAFTYMRQTLGYRPPRIGNATPPEPAGPHPGDVEIPGGVFQLGAAENHPFVFDNEMWAHPVEVAPFRIAKAPVTNAEFRAFVEDGGYEREDLWSFQGWAWRQSVALHNPVYWRNSGSWRRMHFDKPVELEPHHPVVHVSWYEAEAYCTWAGRRLPTEAEWELAASGEPDGDGGISPHKRTRPWGDGVNDTVYGNLDSRTIGCVDVGAYPDGDSAFGCRQMLGNVWEWTASPFYPYPGYLVDQPYREYSAPWFGYRKVLKGGCWATRSRLINNMYRNFFLPDRTDIFAGFRTCAVD